MKIKSIENFREHYKTQVRKRNDRNTDTKFVGVYHDEGNKRTNGYFELTHGDKQIHKFLPSILKIAEDGQAIYEFIQNAVDCDSSQFFIFYNEKYFLAVNNGKPFKHKDVLSILNIADTTKDKDFSCENIGRFGIGFKLVHRLVGKDEGIKELTEDYKGPVIFSWNNLKELEQLLENSPVSPNFVKNPINLDKNPYPWLFKIIATNFPTQPGEKVRDINFKETVLFPYSELKEIVEYLKENFKIHQGKFNFESLKQGSLFFLKLGEGKKVLLDNDYRGLENGVQYSMNFLKNLKEVYINDNSLKKTDLTIKKFIIKKGTEAFNEINPDYQNCDIKVVLGYTDYKRATEIRKSPNFYKYFPMGDETNGFSFIIHCDSFDIEANRRKLHDSNKNRKLFPKISDFIIQYIDEQKEKNRDEFLKIYANILVSKIPDEDNNRWLYEIFFEKLLDYIQTNIPVQGGYSDNAKNVKINKLQLNLNLSEFGLNDIYWFEWNKKEDQILIDEVKNKFEIKEWDIRDIVEKAKLESINNWIKKVDKEDYKAFLQELEKSKLREKTKSRIREIKLFKFSDGEFYSFNDLLRKTRDCPPNWYFNIKYKYTYVKKIFFKTPKTKGIVEELEKIGIILSEISTSKYPTIFSSIEKMPDDKQVYTLIAEKCKKNTLSAKEKKKLFLNFINEATKFNNVAESTLKDLELFCNNNAETKPLKELISTIPTPRWLNAYKIKQDEYFPELNPYLISESGDIFKLYEQNQDSILAELTTAEEIKSLIKLYQDNHRAFFKDFIIKKDNNKFVIDDKTNETYQVQSADKEARKFLDKNCSDKLFALPYEFVEYKEEEGIVKADDLHSLILNLVDVDKHKETLVDIVKYKAKHKFLQKLSEFRFNSEIQYTKEDYEYKIIDLACRELKGNDYQKFKDKVLIKTENQDLKLTEIPPFIDKIKIDNYEISLAKILPDNYKNSDHLSSLINQFISLGLNKEGIGNLFGVSEEPKLSVIFQMFSKQVETLENDEQLAFIILYNKYIENIDLKSFKVLANSGVKYDLTHNFYIKQFRFLVDDASLDDKYKGIEEILGKLPFSITDENQLLKEPYFSEEAFICPALITKNLSNEQKLSFVQFLFKKWNEKSNKTIIKNIDWSKINDIETENILGFNPKTSVHPSEYACEREILPDYLTEWIGKEETKIDFLSDLGVWTEKSVVIELRKYLSGKIKDFHNNRLAQETRFNEDDTNLFNSFLWLKEKEIILKTAEQFKTFKKAVDVINENGANNGGLEIKEEFDFEELKKKAREWEASYYKNWQEKSNVSIFLYEDELPKTISLDEIENFVFYRYSNGNYLIKDNRIYISSNTDKKKTLQKVAYDENNNFSFEKLWQLFGEHTDNKTEKLKQEIARLKLQVSKTDNTTLSTGFSSDISKNDQKEANREAKEIVKEKLEGEGFEFTEGIGKYSIIDGVYKDDVEYPLVVKSYKYQDEALKIGANEWIQLVKPNSMFWIHFGNQKLGCLKLYDLLRNQDKLRISFSTENLDVEDRLEKFAELLRYFDDVHFDFNSLKPNDYSVAKDLSDYRFEERRNEEDLSSDDESIL